MKRILVDITLIGNRLAMVPADAIDEEVMGGLDRKKRYMVSVAAGKREGPLAKYWGAIHMLRENLPEGFAEAYPTADDLSEAIRRRLGYTSGQRWDPINQQFVDVRTSIALASPMTDDEMAEFLLKVDQLTGDIFGWPIIETWQNEQEAKKAMRGRA